MRLFIPAGKATPERPFRLKVLVEDFVGGKRVATEYDLDPVEKTQGGVAAAWKFSHTNRHGESADSYVVSARVAKGPNGEVIALHCECWRGLTAHECKHITIVKKLSGCFHKAFCPSRPGNREFSRDSVCHRCSGVRLLPGPDGSFLKCPNCSP